MAFGLRIGRPRWLLTIWSFFIDWTWHWMPLLPRLIGRSPVGDVETRELGSSENNTARIEHGEAYSNTRDAQGQFISGGITGIVELLDDGTALKSPFPDSDIESHVLDIAKKATIYRRIGPHKRLVQLLGHSRDGLVLEYMGNGDLKTYLQTHSSIPTNLKLKWAYQAAEAVELIHRNGLIRCDVKPRNFLLDAALDIKVIDFSGSSLDGSKPASGEGTRFFLPRHWAAQPTVATDLFALGSTLFELFQGSSPYEEVPSDELQRLYREQEFPDVSDMICGPVIKQCWLSEFESAAQVQTAVGDIISASLNVDCTHLDGLDTGKDMLIEHVGSPKHIAQSRPLCCSAPSVLSKK
ncbi:uncharacterized protein LDX57_003586 [Aspergillus melleus]|uniref:uncharacterized protein n=1 Tax=Aspergillus melleus TaxID=138277 RepID=UPI001E8D89BF|nr:uncharacterized protein LDX57_003586 [Aspergillus melleus]KAH8425842.1 hypothetical protein LDX57_003586 [Aspergillus melleus]